MLRSRMNRHVMGTLRGGIRRVAVMDIWKWRKLGRILLFSGFALLVTGGVLRLRWFVWIGSIAMFVGMVVDLVFLKCPKCGRRLPVFRYVKECPECGQDLKDFY